jgi:8-oxo-dGTP pyrophosphatase MutT (NUDIX family)
MAEYDWFLTSTVPLRPANAAAALLVLDDARYLMQLRDQKAEIFYPGHWGLFGGAIEPGEDAAAALKRELCEELGLENVSPRFFTRLDFDLTELGSIKFHRSFFEVSVSSAAVHGLVLGEGSAMAAFAAEDLLTGPRVVPYDAFAVWAHYHRERLGHK